MAKKFLTSIDLNGNQLIKPVLENVTSNPTTVVEEGRIAFDTTNHVPIVHNGADWKNLQYEIPVGTYMTPGKHTNLTAIEGLTGTNGFLKKTADNTWTLDTSTYLLSNANAVSATKLKDPRNFSIKGGATAEAINFNGLNDVALNITAIDPAKITLTEDYRFVTDAQISIWNAKETPGGAQVRADKALTDANAYTNDKITKLGTASTLNTGTTSGTIPILGTGGKLDDSMIPKIAISDTFVIATQEAMLTLTAEVGDVAIRSDESKTYILTKSPASTLVNWQELQTPASPVQSVAGKVGAVTLDKSDVGLGNVDDTPDTDKPVSSKQATAIGKKVDKVANKGLSSNDYTTIEKDKLDGIQAEANKYIHPADHPASFITESDEKQFVTKTQKSNWTAKETPEDAQVKATKAFTDSKDYVDGRVKTDVPAKAKFTDTVYTHPANHPASMIEETETRKFVTPEQIASWTSHEGAIPMGKEGQYFSWDKTWATLNTTAVKEGTNLYYTDTRVKTYGDTQYLGKTATAEKANGLAISRFFSIGGNTGLTATNVSFNGGDNVSLTLTGTLKTVNGGTGYSDPKHGITRKVKGTFTTSATSYPITHGLNTDDIIAQVFTSSGELVECDITSAGGKVTFGFNVAPLANTLKYVIVG